MIIIVPIDKKDLEDSKIAPLNDAKSFVKLFIESGKIKNYEFIDNFSNEIFDYIIVNSKNEELEEVYDLGARALLARANMSIEDILEALMFSELDEIR